ncbi:hypothetical protein QE152_g31429 [Popillia japonica]|uniref:Uncharacterized protein n=1 Tax=Popillia japonica TaxID=7064 RepID=A0AAW1J1K7_POPJA
MIIMKTFQDFYHSGLSFHLNPPGFDFSSKLQKFFRRVAGSIYSEVVGTKSSIEEDEKQKFFRRVAGSIYSEVVGTKSSIEEDEKMFSQYWKSSFKRFRPIERALITFDLFLR